MAGVVKAYADSDERVLISRAGGKVTEWLQRGAARAEILGC